MKPILKKLVSLLATAVMQRLRSRLVRGRAPALAPVGGMRRRRLWR